MSEIKLTIDKVIEHCDRKVKSYDSTNIDEIISKYGIEPNFVKEYLEHKQVAEWLKELKHLRGAMKRIVERLEEYREESEQFGVSGMFTDMMEAVKEEGADDEL